ERRRRGMVSQRALLLAHLGERQPFSAKLLWDRDAQVVGCPQLVEVLLKESVLPVVDGRPLGKPCQHLIAQDLGFRRWHDRSLSLRWRTFQPQWSDRIR